MIFAATESDIPGWLALVREVEPLFGPMPSFDITLRNKIAAGDALSARDLSGQVTGGILLGGAPPAHWIRWLAVRKAARGQGIGQALVAAALARCPDPCTVSLVTFGADNVQGRPARGLYESFGFTAAEVLPRGPEGGTRQKFVLVRG
jgi:GNAT superfamily N-acetyltransferase